MRATRHLLLSFLLLCLGWPASAQPAGPEVSAFSPHGTVKRVRQAQAVFSTPMVPFGDLRLADPFEVSCPEAGVGRWVDTRIWVYDFARDLPAGIRCVFTRRAGLRSLDGRPLTGPAEFAFTTGGPAIRASQPWEGADSIDEDQAFVLELDAPATAASVEQHAGFKVDSLPDRIGLRILAGEPREAILRARYGRRPRPDGVLVVQARQRFPTKARVTLLWGKGVASLGGVPTDEDQALAWEVRGPFTLNFACLRENPRAQCVPVSSMRLLFGAQVAWHDAQRIGLVGPGGQRYRAERDGEEEAQFVNGVVFKGPFPEKATFTLEIPAGLKDDAGRVPVNAAAFPLSVKTDAFPPLAKFAARFGILERYADPALPVTLRNIEPTVHVTMLGLPSGPAGLSEWVKGKVLRVPPDRAGEILPWLRRLASANRETSMFSSLPMGTPVKAFGLPKPHGSEPMEVVGIPLKAPGFYLVEIESARLGQALLNKPSPMFVPAGSLVTNLSIHLKWGKAGSLVWVTTLDKAQPVRAARVTVFDCNNRVLWKGATDRHGITRPAGLPSKDAAPQCPVRYGEGNETIGYLGGGLFVTAQTADDLSFVHSSWEQGIEPWRFNLPTYDGQGPLNVQTVLDRPLYRAGETVSMKHVIRRQELRGLAMPPPADRPGKLRILHQGSKDEYELPLSWDAAGIAESAWPIPRGAKLGRYQIEVEVPAQGGRRPGQTETLIAGSFRVEEFRVPLLRATLKPPTDPLVAVSEFPLDISVQYLGGGGASNQSVTVRAQLSPRQLPTFDLFEDFTFANGALAPGIVRRGEGAYEGEEGDEEADARAPARAPQSVHQRSEVTLDAAGSARVPITRLPRSPVPQDVLTEVEFRDPNGEVLTAATRVPLWPAGWLVGLRPESWAASRDDLRVMAAVVDLAGKPIAQVPVEIEVLERKIYANRKRLVGGFYAYEYVQEIKRVSELCRGVTDQRGLMACGGKTSASGELILQARIQDDHGHAVAAHQEVWVAGSDEWWFEVHDSDRIDLLPERKRYEPGETATLQVRMPFREATALVTIEREGVLDAFVAPLSGREPVIKVPIKGDHAPNVFVSALVVRGRVGSPEPTALVDLGRPAHKLGITELRVGWRAYELRVTVSPDRQVYQVREKARVRIRARTAGGGPPPAGSEAALAAVDEGLLELARNPSWDLLDNMMRRRPYLVETATAQGQVVGRRHFGLKALPQGGGGGRQATRELFDTLLLWKARVPLDALGEATVEVPLNDSLTSFRIVAVATGGDAMFGTGRASIRSTRDLMVLPGIAPLAREGDRMRPEVTVRNTTDKPMAVTVTARAQGLKEALAPESLPLASGEARVVGWDVTVPTGVDVIKWEIDAAAKSGPSDRVRVTQRVIDAVPVRTYQATLAQWERTVREPAERPADALPGRGDIRVQLGASLVDGMSGVRDWMREYPYHCLEQDVSRAVALRDRERWRALMAELPSYQDADGLLKYFPTMDRGNEVLTSYVLAIASEAGWSIPAGPRGRMEQGLKKFVTGVITRRPELPTADLSIRKVQAVEALSRYGNAEAGLLGSIAIEPDLWPTSAVLDWWSLLSRMPGAPDRARRLAQAEQIMRARLTMQGTVMKFSTESRDGLWWLMVSPDVNALRLILHLVRTGQWQQDVPRLMSGALARQRRGVWGLTLANAWGVLAVEKFSAAYEKTPVTGRTTATLGSVSRSVDWARVPKGASVVLPWPPRREEVVIDHAGTGKPWITLQARAAIPRRAPLSSGYAISRTLTAVERKQAGAWSRGDIVRVRLEVEAQSDMTWVVINDPVPAGASHLGSGLGGQSRIALAGQERSACPCVAFEERAFDGVRAYYPYVRKGTWIYEYTIRLNQSGRFLLPPTRVEALYAPEAFGELPNPPLEVKP